MPMDVEDEVFRYEDPPDASIIQKYEKIDYNEKRYGLVRVDLRIRCIACYEILYDKFNRKIANGRCNKTYNRCADCDKPYCQRCFPKHAMDHQPNS